MDHKKNRGHAIQRIINSYANVLDSNKVRLVLDQVIGSKIFQQLRKRNRPFYGFVLDIKAT